MTSRFAMDGRVALVTGGGTGIGRGAALVLAAHRADVVLAGRRPAPLDATADEVRALGRRALALPTTSRIRPRASLVPEPSEDGMGIGVEVAVVRVVVQLGHGPSLSELYERIAS